MPGLILGIASLLIVLAVIFYVIAVYNRLIKLREYARNAFAQIDVQLKRRHDLIPNLVETAKGYLKHERETLDAVVDARARATSAQISVDGDPTKLAAMKELAASEGLLRSALGRLLAVAEAYPDLKANENMQQLSAELSETEDLVASSRSGYNDQVNAYNEYKQTFPPVLIANIFNFDDASYFEIQDESVRDAPAVSFD